MSKRDLIDLYFHNKLSPEEAEKFKELLDQDSQFQKDFQDISDIVEGIVLHEEMEFKNHMQDVEESLEQGGFFSGEDEGDIISVIQSESMKAIIEEVASEFEPEKVVEPAKVVQLSKTRNLVARLSIAASVLILILAGWYFLNDQNSGENYLANYFEPAADELSPLVERELDELGFGGLDPTLLEQLQNMMDAYMDGRGDLFFQIYKENMEDFSNSPFSNEIDFYYAQMLISERRIEDALPVLERLNSLNPAGYLDKIKWNLALLYQETGNSGEAEELLMQIPQNSEYYSLSRRLLEELDF